MAAEKPLTLGPFTGGMNTMSDPTDVDDKQCVEALNFDQDPNGSLKSRPPFTSAGTAFPLSSDGDARLLGFFYASDGTPYLIASDGQTRTYRFSGGSWTLITARFAASAMVQFDGKAWLVSPQGATNGGGYWTPSGGFVRDDDMPRGSSAAVYKDRIWIASGANSPSPTSMFYSKLIVEGAIWATAASREVQVSPGDGQAIVALAPYFGSLLVFRNQSIYSYAYATSTAAATISVVAPGIGLANSDSLVAYESYLYFMYDDKAYEFVQARAQRINQQVPFRAGSQAGVAVPFAVSKFGRRILFSYYDFVYVFNVDTRTWTRWQSTVWGPLGPLFEPIPGTSAVDAYVMPSKAQPITGETRTCPILKINETLNASDMENFTCVLQTKNYSYDLPSHFKRMFWWGVDAVFRQQVRGEAHPIVQTQSVTWRELFDRGLTWADLRMSTWDAPVGSDQIAEITEYDLGGVGFQRKFAKFKKAMRFRQVYFRVSFTADGSISTSPVYLFTLRARLSIRQTVSKAIS